MDSAARQMLRLRRQQAASLQELKDRVAAARAEMAARLRRANDSGRIISAAWRAKFLDGTQGIYDRLGKDLDSWGKRITGDVAKAWHDEALDDITTGKPGAITVVNDILAFDKARVKSYWELIHPDNAQSLAGVMTKKMREQDLAILRQSAITVFRQGQLEAVPQRELAKRIQQEWDKAAGNMEGARFVDAAGRPWDNGRYLQMLVRTTTARVARESYFDTLNQNGDDLVMVKATGDNCPACQAWSGVIVSITGATKEFPTYQDARAGGVFHPNCDCLTQRVDETVHAQDIQRQRATPNAADWTDLKQVRDYKASFGTNQATGPTGGSTAGSQGTAGSGATKKKVTITTKVAPAPVVKPFSIPPAPQPQAAPGGSLSWKPAKTVDEARKQIQDHMDANLVARQAGKLPDYKRSGGSGPYLKRFKGKPEDLDHVSLAGGLDLEDANEIGAHFFEMQRACDALGIPRLRGLQTMAQVPGAIADMGDGVLRLSTNTLKQRLQAMRLGGSAEANTWAEAGRWKDRRLKQSAKNLREAEKEVKKAKELLASYGPSDVKVRDFYQKRVDALEDWRRQLVEHHAEVEKDVANHLATKPVAGSKAPKKDPWAKGMPTVKRPFTCEAYGSPAGLDDYQATNWHEFGHHVHQQHDVQDEVDWMGFKAMNQGKSFQMGTDLKPRKNRTLYEQAVNEAFTASSGPGADWPGTATNYGAYNSMEWFAENFSTAMMGREDLVDPGVKPFIMFHVDKLKAAGLPKMKGA